MGLTVRVGEDAGHLDADALEVGVGLQEGAPPRLVLVGRHGVELRLKRAVRARRHKAIERHLGRPVNGQVHERRSGLELVAVVCFVRGGAAAVGRQLDLGEHDLRSEEHTSELQSLAYLVCRLLLEKKKKKRNNLYSIEVFCKSYRCI